MNASLIFYSDSELLEGPVYDMEHHVLYFVSIFDHLVYCLDPATKEMWNLSLDSPVSCVFPLGYKKVLAASQNGFYELDFSTLGKKFAFQLELPKGTRYNDGIMDAAGRLLIGTMGYPDVTDGLGEVFSYNNGLCKTIIENTTISNGMAFTKDNKILYFVDTPTKKVAKYKYEIHTGDVRFDGHVITFTGEGSPDGMSIDNEGMLWIAEWGGGQISKWNPMSGQILATYPLPCPNVTSCCFDPKGNLYVTTAKSASEDDNLGGGLFYIEPN